MARPVLTANAWLRWGVIEDHVASFGGSPRILEVGMGQGAVGARLAEIGPYTGVEPDDASRRVAESRLPATARVLADVGEVGPDERFDVVCAFEVLEHIEDDAGALRTWVERLRPGGLLLVSVPAHQHRYGAGDTITGHFRRYSRADLARLAEGAGLSVVQIDAVGMPLGYALEVVRNKVASRRLDSLGSVEEQTAASGRFLQPPAAAAPLTQALTLPFRWAQRPFRRTDLGTGWVMAARQPAR